MEVEEKKLMMTDDYQQYVSIIASVESVPVMVGCEKRTKMMIAHVVPFKGGGVV